MKRRNFTRPAAAAALAVAVAVLSACAVQPPMSGGEVTAANNVRVTYDVAREEWLRARRLIVQNYASPAACAAEYLNDRPTISIGADPNTNARGGVSNCKAPNATYPGYPAVFYINTAFSWSRARLCASFAWQIGVASGWINRFSWTRSDTLPVPGICG